MSRYGRLRIYAIIAGFLLVLINGTAIAFSGPSVLNVPFLLLGLAVIVVGGDLAGAIYGR